MNPSAGRTIRFSAKNTIVSQVPRRVQKIPRPGDFRLPVDPAELREQGRVQFRTPQPQKFHGADDQQGRGQDPDHRQRGRTAYISMYTSDKL